MATTKIRKGADFALYVGGVDNTASAEAIVAETIESEIILADTMSKFSESNVATSTFAMPAGNNFGTMFDVFVTGEPSTLEVILNDSGTGDNKQLIFCLKKGTNYIGIFEETLNPDELILSLTDSESAYTYDVRGWFSIGAFLGAGA